MIGSSSPGRGSEFFSSPPPPDRVRVHPASYPMGNSGSFPGGKAAGVVKLTTQLQLVSRSRKSGAIHPLPPIRLHGVFLS